MNIREDVIYARQSVDRKDSISIESQIDFCKYELKGGSCRVFKDTSPALQDSAAVVSLR